MSPEMTTENFETTTIDPYYHPEVAYLVEKLKGWNHFVLERKSTALMTSRYFMAFYVVADVMNELYHFC